MVALEYVARIAGVEPGVDVEVLDAVRAAAVQWYKDAGVPETTASPLYDFWVANLAAWMYDNRGNADARAAIPDYIVESVHQIRPYDDEVTT